MHAPPRCFALTLVALACGCSPEPSAGSPDAMVPGDAALPTDAPAAGCDDEAPRWSELLATENGVAHIATHGTTLFISDYKTDLADVGGRVYSVDIDGENPTEIVHRPLIDDRNGFALLGADATHVYWSETFVGSRLEVWRARRSDGSIVRLAEVASANTALLDGNYFYVTTRDDLDYALNRVSKETGTLEPLGAIPTPSIRAVDESRIYGTKWGDIWWVDKSGGAATTLASAGDEVRGLTLDNGHVYYATVGPGAQISRVAKTGGAPEPLHAGPGRALAIDGDYLYFLGDQPPIQRIPRDGGPAEQLMCGEAVHFDRAMVITDGWLAWGYQDGTDWGVARGRATPVAAAR